MHRKIAYLSSINSPLSTYRTYAINRASLSLTVDSSNCIEKFGYLNFSTGYTSTSQLIS